MSATQPFVRLLALLGAALVLTTPHDAGAVQLQTVVANIHQLGFSAGVSLGHAAIGSTNYNRIVVSATYSAACAHPSMLPTTGQRSLTSTSLIGGLSLTTTVPLRVPTIVTMPGFDLLPAGSIVACTYDWTSKAVESGFNVGTGISFPVGGGEQGAGSTVRFVMLVPSNEGGIDPGGCLP